MTIPGIGFVEEPYVLGACQAFSEGPNPCASGVVERLQFSSSRTRLDSMSIPHWEAY